MLGDGMLNSENHARQMDTPPGDYRETLLREAVSVLLSQCV